MNKRILHLQLSGNPGGIVTLTRDIAIGSNEINDFYFIFEGGIVTDQLVSLGYKCYVGTKNKSRYIAILKEFLHFIKKNKYDVIICHTTAPIALVMFLFVNKRKTKLLLYEHGDLYENFKLPNFKTKINKFLFIKSSKHANNIIAISNYVNSQCSKFLKKKSITIYNGINTDNFYNNTEKTFDDNITFLYVGRLIKEKGVNILVESFSKLLFEYKNIKLIVVGDGPEMKRLIELIKEKKIENNVEFTGNIVNTSIYYNKSHFFCHPAIWNEGFGITLIEAMCSGLPCLTFDVGAMRELVIDNQTGFIVKKISVDDYYCGLKNCMKLIASGEYNKFSKAANRQGEEFSINKTIKKLEKLY